MGKVKTEISYRQLVCEIKDSVRRDEKFDILKRLRKRLKNVAMTTNNSGILLMIPLDNDALADDIKTALEDEFGQNGLRLGYDVRVIVRSVTDRILYTYSPELRTRGLILPKIS